MQFFLFSQSSCGCEKEINILIQKISSSYAGYADKINIHTKSAYDSLIKNAISKSKEDSSFYQCYLQLKEIANFFKDPHLEIRFHYTDSRRLSFIKTFSQLNRSGLDIDSLYDVMKSHGMDSIEGVWNDYFGVRKILMAKDSLNHYVGYIYKGDSLYWHKGQVRLEMTCKPFVSSIKYYKDDHTPRMKNGYLANKLIYIEGVDYLKKDGANVFIDERTMYTNLYEKKVGVLKIPDLTGSNWRIIDSVIEKNLKKISTNDLLIIDFRNNGGGGYNALKKLFPFIFTSNNVVEKYAIKSSEDNITDYELLLNKGYYLDSSAKKRIINKIQLLEENRNKLCEVTEEIFLGKKALTSPRKIVFLINGATASAAEMFVKIAKDNSSKVKGYGNKSYGNMDYGDISIYSLNCDLFKVSIPKSRSSWVDKERYNYIGFPPDVYIPDYVQNWEEFVIKNEVTSYDYKNKK
jgi:hypothetical protein